jgi:DNA polymerase V
MREIYSQTDTRVMMAIASISCGEPQEISTELEKIDLNEFITGGKDGVFLIRAINDSMEHEIRNGDWMTVNRNLSPECGDAVVAYLNGQYLVKDYKPKRNGLFLVPKNPKYPAQKVTADDDFETFGVVTGILRKFKKI